MPTASYMLAQVNGITIGYETFGDPSGEPMLLISGLNTPMTRWTHDFCQKLAANGFYVIRYDNRDCGISEHLDDYVPSSKLSLFLSRLIGLRIDPPYRLSDMVNDAICLLDALGVSAAHIVGRSMGGMIAQILASTFPDRALSLTVIMSTTGNKRLPLPSWSVLKHMLAKVPNPQNHLAKYLKHRVDYTKAIASKRYPVDEFYIRSRVIDDIKRSGFHPGAAKRQFSALVQAGDIRKISQMIKAPTLVIHGDADELVPLECGVDVHKNIPGSRLCIVKDMGHSLQPVFHRELIAEIAKVPLNLPLKGASELDRDADLIAEDGS